LIHIGYQKTKFHHELSHRDYLGALMNLGIKRETIGDILVHPDSCQLIAFADMAQYIVSSLSRVGSLEVEAEIRNLKELKLPELKFKDMVVTVASLRLDALIAEAFSLSRSDAADYIAGGKVYLDFEECTHPSESVKEGSIMTLRGMGKAILLQVGQMSKKNRTFVTIRRFL
ncbi:MAG: YlmH/Sll1252 family protein, partial [Clostridia bacterium]|nr:YlmH/Sll1252 family protein [Clostridia bacterium]